MRFILPVILFACDPQPKTVKLDGQTEQTIHTLEPVQLPMAQAMSEDGKVLDKAKVEWTLNNPELANLSEDGKQIIPLKEGEIVATAKAGEATQTFTVKVALPDRVVVTGINPDQQLTVGDTVQVQAQVVDGETPLPMQATWSSSDMAVVSVQDGRITAVAPGSATLTAMSGEMKTDVPVTVVAPTMTDAVNPDGTPATPPTTP